MTIYDSYNAECTAKMIKSIDLANISEANSPTNIMKFDPANDTQKQMLWKQCVAWHCIGYSAAPLSNYINSLVFPELLNDADYFGHGSDETVCIDSRDSLGRTSKTEKPSWNDSKMKLRVLWYSNGEYLYMLVDGGLTIRYKS